MNNSERLKEIKSTRYTYLETSKTDLGNDFEWLIDRVEELEDEIWRDPRQAMLEDYYAENEQLRNQLESEIKHKMTYREIAFRYQDEKNRYREAALKAMTSINFEQYAEGARILEKASEESE